MYEFNLSVFIDADFERYCIEATRYKASGLRIFLVLSPSGYQVTCTAPSSSYDAPFVYIEIPPFGVGDYLTTSGVCCSSALTLFRARAQYVLSELRLL